MIRRLGKDNRSDWVQRTDAFWRPVRIYVSELSRKHLNTEKKKIEQKVRWWWKETYPFFQPSLRLEAVYALRGLLQHGTAQEILTLALKSSSCGVAEAALQTLRNSKHAKSPKWLPIDQVIIQMTIDNDVRGNTNNNNATISTILPCILTQLEAYLRAKGRYSESHQEALERLERLIDSADALSSSSRPRSEGIPRRQKRAWLTQTCDVWGTPAGAASDFDFIQTDAEFREDNFKYDSKVALFHKIRCRVFNDKKKEQ